MSDEKYIQHKYIKPKSIEARLYQQTIFAKTLKGNTLVVLPTGLGKTIILALLTAKRMEQYPDSFILIVAPTKPLVEQHLKTFQKVFNIIEDEIVMLTGSVLPEKRIKIWKQAQIIIATPQVVENDLLANRLDLKQCSLLGVDEAHRAVGDYAYVYAAKQYMKKAANPLILAITASPGSEQEKINEVCKSLSIKHVETRIESSADVKPYVQKTDVDWIHLELPEKFQRIKSLFERSLSSKLKELKRLGWLQSSSISVHRKDLLKLPPQITKQFDKTENVSELYLALGLVGSSIRLTHALELLETQGISSLIKYFEKMHKEAKSSKATRNLISLLSEDALVVAYDVAKQISDDGFEHPKIPELTRIVSEMVSESPDSRILVFTQYRNSAKKLAEILNSIDKVKASRFIGQASKAGDKGFTQKKQLEVMQQFRDGLFNCLVATSVGEEGLDVSECDLVVFYECVPSAIRNIQRRGRTGRQRAGKVVVLITKGTRDEGYFWAARRKERQMKRNLRELEKYGKQAIDTQQRSMEDFFAAATNDSEIEEDKVSDDAPLDELSILSDEALSKIEEEIESDTTESIPQLSDSELENIDKFFAEDDDSSVPDKVKIIVDSREAKSGIAKELSQIGVTIDLQQITVGDFILSSRVGVERKDVADFSQSIIDGRLFTQLIALKRSFPVPLLIIEGETLYGHRALNPEAIRGAISAITLNFDIRIIWSRSTKDTARYLRNIANREQRKGERTPSIRPEKAPIETSELLEFIIAGFPNINTVLAKRILEKFGTLENFFNASVDEIQEIKGIGKKIALEIKELITAIYKPDD
ncbi:MAG: DEAD/DEAH box helicase [Candidatus Heimdallarchaeota archaeon]|nr:DEAD/DEAH box helicase [Candidatus Heimdallarchaeota archaeon]MBY8995327.1 DEAD/DEAH box helicase [Candidatus Heimdallarchaeota archaeon]